MREQKKKKKGKKKKKKKKKKGKKKKKRKTLLPAHFYSNIEIYSLLKNQTHLLKFLNHFVLLSIEI